MQIMQTTQTNNLAEKIELIKLSNTPHKLSTFVKLYLHHRHFMYINYMYNAKVVIDFLTDSGRLPLDLEDDVYGNLDSKLLFKASMCVSYTVSEMASIVAENMGEKYNLQLRKKLVNSILAIIITA